MGALWRWVCRRLGHKKPMIIDGPWVNGYGLIGRVKQRPEHCSRCGEGFVYWTSDLKRRGMEP